MARFGITSDNVVSEFRASLSPVELADFESCDAATQFTIACEELAFDPDAPLPVLADFATSGNIAPLGRAYRDGFLDAFQARALLAWMSPLRWNRFDLRWRVCGGSMDRYYSMLDQMES